MSRRRDDAATMTVGLAGTAGAGALRNEALTRSYRERGPHPIPRPVLLAERRLIKRPRGRNMYLAGAGLAAVSVPAAAVGTTRTFGKADDDSFLRAGMRGARQAAFARTDTVREKAPARLVAGNYAAGAGVALGAGSLTHLALHRKVSGNPRHALASTVGALAGTASLPMQSRMTQRASRGQYVVTPTGVRRAKQKPARPSSKASVYDGRGGNAARFRAQTQVGKRVLDPGASMSRGERRARYAAAGPPIPIIGDIMQARTAGKYAAAPYKRRSMVENYMGGQAGSIGGMAAGAAGALTAANRSKGFDRRAQAANDRIDGAKANIRTKAGLQPTGQSLSSRALAHPRTPAKVKTGAAAIASSSAGRAIARNPKVAAVGALAGGLMGGQIGQQVTYGRTMTRDDRYRASLRKADAPRAMTIDEQKSLRRKKNQAAALSLGSGATGLGALAATGATVAAARRPGIAARFPRATQRVKNAQVPLLTAGAGIGGYNSLNYAAIQHREARSVGKALRARLVEVPDLPRKKGMWAVTRAGVGGAGHTTAGDVARAYDQAGFKTSSGAPRTLHAEEFDDVVDSVQRRRGLTTSEFLAGLQARRKREAARRVGKAYRIPRPRVLGIRRAPAMRRGFIRQTRLPSGLTRVSSVRGGLA